MHREPKRPEDRGGSARRDAELGKSSNQSESADFEHTRSGKWVTTRRVFLKSTLLVAAAPWLCTVGEVAGTHNQKSVDARSILRFGVVTDSHYADIETSGTRVYRQSLAKMRECVELMNEKDAEFMIHLGDLKNGAPDRNLEHLRLIESEYARFKGPRYHVLGNHDMDSLSKTDFQSVVENTGIASNETYYSFERGAIHFVVLDANFTSDGDGYDRGNFHWTDPNIPEDQLRWLQEDIYSSNRPVVVFVHQLLDSDEGSHYVNNAAGVRAILERSQNVLVVFQGHQHRGQYNKVSDIHYYTLKAMVEGSGAENNAYAVVDILDDFTVSITGYRKAMSKELQSYGYHYLEYY